MTATETILEVAERIRESADVVSLRLAPVEGPLCPFRAGART